MSTTTDTALIDPLLPWANDDAGMPMFNSPQLPVFGTDGAPTVPPDSHILDCLARDYALVDEFETHIRPAADTVAVLTQLPACDFCRRRARYDARVPHRGRLVYAYFCADCLRSLAGPTPEPLAAGRTTNLITHDEVPDQVRDQVFLHLIAQGRHPDW